MTDIPQNQIEILWISYLNDEKIEINNGDITTLSFFPTKSIHCAYFDILESIKRIEIYDIDQFNTFIKYIEYFKNIESLFIGCEAGAEIQYFPETMALLKNLKEIGIECLDTAFFPKCIKKLTKLESVAFSFVQWPSEEIFYGLPEKQIKKLYIYHSTWNKDEDIGEEVLSEKIGNFENLEELGLIYNEALKSLPRSINKLKKLKKLLLYGDIADDVVLENIPDELYALENLEVLDIFACEHVHQLSSAFQKLKNLQKVDYINSSIFHSPFSDAQLANLRELSCQGELPDLSKCKKLKVLRYSGANSLEYCFQHLRTIQNKKPYPTIDLADMNIHAAPQLEELYIENGYGAEKGEIMNVNIAHECKGLKVFNIKG